MKLLSVKPSTRDDKRYMAVFLKGDGKQKTVHFGDPNLDNYTIHKDPERKKRYLDRHRDNESWNTPDTPGACSRWILWNLPGLRTSIADFKKRFNL